MEAIAEIKASAKDRLSTEICWETITEQTRSVIFTAPKCGLYDVRQYQKIRDYHFRFQEKKWFHMNNWQTYMTEYTSCYHDNSQRFEVDPDCNCKNTASSYYDGQLHVDFGQTSMLVPFRKTDTGIEAIIEGGKIPLEPLSDDVSALMISKGFIPESLRFFGNMTEESYDAIASPFTETEVSVTKSKFADIGFAEIHNETMQDDLPAS